MRTDEPEYIKAPESVEGNLKIVKDVMAGKNLSKADNARLNLCIINAAAILFIAGKAQDFEDGVKLARYSIESGNALKKLLKFVKISNNICKPSNAD